ncbi:hypothetical protein BVRB_6g140190 [Beta vulgaris subsp. vulgaris]|uniref:Uncharacterized protein n=1 Tax=Beta vulgaris subsp. vulgaris TaxID=3555 RepID=A0A0J8C8Y5_BETVV|nr:hypothetical protein BVRB_6g140190 [Beta vulgaris subsp. vulgaris]
MSPSYVKIGLFFVLWLLMTAGAFWTVEGSRSLISPRCKKPMDCVANCPRCQFVTCLNTWCVCGCVPR